MTKREALLLLGLSDGANPEDAKKAYRALAKALHPDLHQNKSEQERRSLEQLQQQVNLAYEIVQAEFRAGASRIYGEPGGGSDYYARRAKDAERAAEEYARRSAAAEEAARRSERRAQSAEQQAQEAQAKASKAEERASQAEKDTEALRARVGRPGARALVALASLILVFSAVAVWIVRHQSSPLDLLGQSDQFLEPLDVPEDHGGPNDPETIYSCPSLDCPSKTIPTIGMGETSACKVKETHGRLWLLEEFRVWTASGEGFYHGWKYWDPDPETVEESEEPNPDSRPLNDYLPHILSPIKSLRYYPAPVNYCRGLSDVVVNARANGAVYGIVIQSEMCPKGSCLTEENFGRDLINTKAKLLLYTIGANHDNEPNATLETFQIFQADERLQQAVFAYPMPGDLVVWAKGQRHKGYISLFEPENRNEAIRVVEEMLGTANIDSWVETFKK